MYENLNESLDGVEAFLDGVCVRCGGELLERRGNHTNPRLRCKACGLEVQVYSKVNRLVDMALALGMGGALVGLLFGAFVVAVNAVH